MDTVSFVAALVHCTKTFRASLINRRRHLVDRTVNAKAITELHHDLTRGLGHVSHLRTCAHVSATIRGRYRPTCS